MYTGNPYVASLWDPHGEDMDLNPSVFNVWRRETQVEHMRFMATTWGYVSRPDLRNGMLAIWGQISEAEYLVRSQGTITRDHLFCN